MLRGPLDWKPVVEAVVELDDRLLVVDCPACCLQQAQRTRSCTTFYSRMYRILGRPAVGWPSLMENPLMALIMMLSVVLPVTLESSSPIFAVLEVETRTVCIV